MTIFVKLCQKSDYKRIITLKGKLYEYIQIFAESCSFDSFNSYLVAQEAEEEESVEEVVVTGSVLQPVSSRVLNLF